MADAPEWNLRPVRRFLVRPGGRNPPLKDAKEKRVTKQADELPPLPLPETARIGYVTGICKEATFDYYTADQMRAYAALALKQAAADAQRLDWLIEKARGLTPTLANLDRAAIDQAIREELGNG